MPPHLFTVNMQLGIYTYTYTASRLVLQGNRYGVRCQGAKRVSARRFLKDSLRPKKLHLNNYKRFRFGDISYKLK